DFLCSRQSDSIPGFPDKGEAWASAAASPLLDMWTLDSYQVLPDGDATSKFSERARSQNSIEMEPHSNSSSIGTIGLALDARPAGAMTGDQTFCGHIQPALDFFRQSH